MTVESIKEAIAELPAEQKASLTAWLIRQDREEWDMQMEDDFSEGGRGMSLIEEAEADLLANRLTPLDELLAKAKTNRQKPQA
ncbi:MAG: hypothetical protein ABI165_04520 [Bryobacteraceae bacterium]